MKLYEELDYRTQIASIYLKTEPSLTDKTRYYVLNLDGSVEHQEVEAGEEAKPFIRMPILFWEVIRKHFIGEFKGMPQGNLGTQVLLNEKEKRKDLELNDDKYLKLLIDNNIKVIDKLLNTITKWQMLPKDQPSRRAMKKSEPLS